MSAATKHSLPLVELAIFLALALIGGAAFRLYQMVPSVDEHHQQLRDLRNEYLELGDYVQTTVKELNSDLAAFLQGKSRAAQERFQRRSRAAEQWLRQKEQFWGQAPMDPGAEEPNPDPGATATNQVRVSPHELLPLLMDIRDAYANYLQAARYLMTNAGQPLIQQRLAAREQQSNRESTKLLDLAQQARQRGWAAELALSASQKRFGNLEAHFRKVLFGLLLALGGLCFLLLTTLYRRKVAQTLREQQDQQLVQQAKLDQLAHFSQLAQELAHEIKQPLTAINARLYTLQKTLQADTEAHKDAVVIRNEIGRLDQVVKDFLQLARPAEPKLTPVGAGEALGDIRDLMASQLAQEGIDFQFECEEGLQFLADLQQLKQVLINLVKNAAESLEHRGTIALRAHAATRVLRGESAAVVILEVEDTGPGIPYEIQARIFDPFFSTKAEGTGLGLAIAARIIDKHGGVLEFDTNPGQGTVFRIVLPSCQAEQPYEQSTPH